MESIEFDDHKRYVTALCIAGVDPSGGAGLLADIKVCTLMGVYGCGVPTALTTQSTLGVKGVDPVAASSIAEELEWLLEDVRPDAVKIGMIPTPEGVAAIAGVLKEREIGNIVVDPVLVSTSGMPLVDNIEEAVRARKECLFPIATLVTPNMPESEISGLRDADATYAVLLKGGHGEGDTSTDILRLPGEAEVCFTSERIETKQSHGTGCVLSSAIACGLARGLGLEESIRVAKQFLTERLRKGEEYRLGHGYGPSYLL